MYPDRFGRSVNKYDVPHYVHIFETKPKRSFWSKIKCFHRHRDFEHLGLQFEDAKAIPCLVAMESFRGWPCSILCNQWIQHLRNWHDTYWQKVSCHPWCRREGKFDCISSLHIHHKNFSLEDAADHLTSSSRSLPHKWLHISWDMWYYLCKMEDKSLSWKMQSFTINSKPWFCYWAQQMDENVALESRYISSHTTMSEVSEFYL